MDRTQREKAVKVLTMLRKYKPNIDTYFDSHSLEIIEELLNKMWDAEKFTQFFETNVEFMSDEHDPNNYELFKKSMEYIQVGNSISHLNWFNSKFYLFLFSRKSPQNRLM